MTDNVYKAWPDLIKNGGPELLGYLYLLLQTSNSVL